MAIPGLAAVGSYLLPKAAGWLGNKMGGGGGGGGGAGGGGGPGFFGSPGQQQTTGTRLDPASRKRQDDLYNATQSYVATNPYSTTFSGPTSTMSNMSQAGQQFLTNRLMGPGAYQSQNLGFKPWQDTATANWSYPGPSGGGQQPGGQQPGGQQPPGGQFTPGQPSGVPAAARVEEQNQIQTASTTYDPNTAIADAARVRADGQFRDGGGEGGSDLTPAGRAKLATQGFQPTPAEIAALRGPQVGFDPSASSGYEPDYSGMPQSLNAGPQGRQQPTGFSDEFGGPGLSAPNIDMAAVGPPAIGMQQPEPGFSDEFGGGQPQGPPADGEQFTPASLSAMDTASSAVGDILTADPTARTTVDGASVLNRPEGEGIEAYMNAGGVDSQVEAAQREADRITSERQGRQALANAFSSTSSRAALEDIEAGGQEARMIADIRRQGFDSAAARMDADVGRQQQARLAEAEIQSQETQAERDARLRAAQIGTNIGSTIGQEERAIGTSMMDMGKDQEAIANQQRAQEYEQWLRQQEGGGRELALLNSMMPEGDTERTAQGRSGFDKTLSTVGSVGSAALTLAELLGGDGGEEPGMTPAEIENERLKALLAKAKGRRTGPRGGGRIVPDAVKLRNQPRFNPSGGGGEL